LLDVGSKLEISDSKEDSIKVKGKVKWLECKVT